VTVLLILPYALKAYEFRACKCYLLTNAPPFPSPLPTPFFVVNGEKRVETTGDNKSLIVLFYIAFLKQIGTPGNRKAAEGGTSIKTQNDGDAAGLIHITASHQKVSRIRRSRPRRRRALEGVF